MSDKLVTCEWVAEHGSDPGMRIVEVDVDTEAYGEGHIPNAIAWSWTTQLQDPVTRNVLDPEAFASLMSRSGITRDTHVVLYGDNSNWFAAYALWLLELYGHEQCGLMDGGRVKWLVDNRPTTAAVPEIPPTAYDAPEPARALRAMREEVLAVAEQQDDAVRLVDVRSPAEYDGTVISPPGMSETAQRGGHIPGAVNVPWARAVNEDGTFRPIDELRELYRDAGVSGDGKTIVYCRIGERSAHTWFVLRHLLGYEHVRNYDGSWTEYGSLVDAPIEATEDS